MNGRGLLPVGSAVYSLVGLWNSNNITQYKMPIVYER